MNELVRWQTENGTIVVESDDREPGFQSVSRAGDLIHDAAGRFEDAFQNVRDAAEAALASLRGGALDPDTVELEFGVKLNAAAGAVIAKTSVEGHLKVKMTWGQPARAAEEA
ncbi:CU044_2847 family protein [Spirillospora sp. CA-142024]|uniref:CU044_2847 family protein n=1 Tax=Spirillospora sp. CA-142024 TaxID=3240036 RepID=UPI003D8AAE3B